MPQFPHGEIMARSHASKGVASPSSEGCLGDNPTQTLLNVNPASGGGMTAVDCETLGEARAALAALSVGWLRWGRRALHGRE
jgi:hypothetical protein